VPDPVVVPRADHPISRRNIDPDALRVLYRLNNHKHVAYLVGGSVRDLLLGRQPKDFDIGTDAHPYEIKRLFRNCWIIGRRFRLAHIRFGQKTIEVATFRRNVPEAAAEETVVVASAGPEAPAAAAGDGAAGAAGAEADDQARHRAHDRGHTRHTEHGQIHRDNTFGTPEEDAFRRDFTVNALFYDVATRSIIDYVGGLTDLEQRVIRSIGDARVRFVEDPVRMLRAAVLGARLGFDLDVLVTEAIAIHRHLITKASPARLLEEYFKVLRSGYAEESFRALGRVRLLELVTPEMKSPPDAVWESLARLDAYRRKFPTAPPTLTTVVLIGALLEPLGLLRQRPAALAHEPHAERFGFGILPVARRDLERLHQVMQIVPRLTDPDLPPRVARSLPHRPAFADALTWLEIFGDAPDAVEHWRHVRVHRPAHAPEQPPGGHPVAAPPAAAEGAGAAPARRRRRRRRRRGRHRDGGPGP
jgi:poly(A) polymerase